MSWSNSLQDLYIYYEYWRRIIVLLSKMELGCHLSVIWMSHRCHLGVTWDNLDITCHQLEIAWATIGNYMDNLVALGCQLGVIWMSLSVTGVPFGCYMGVILVSLGCHWGVTWVLHGCNLGVTWISLL